MPRDSRPQQRFSSTDSTASGGDNSFGPPPPRAPRHSDETGFLRPLPMATAALSPMFPWTVQAQPPPAAAAVAPVAQSSATSIDVPSVFVRDGVYSSNAGGEAVFPAPRQQLSPAAPSDPYRQSFLEGSMPPIFGGVPLLERTPDLRAAADSERAVQISPLAVGGPASAASPSGTTRDGFGGNAPSASASAVSAYPRGRKSSALSIQSKAQPDGSEIDDDGGADEANQSESDRALPAPAAAVVGDNSTELSATANSGLGDSLAEALPRAALAVAAATEAEPVGGAALSFVVTPEQQRACIERWGGKEAFMRTVRELYEGTTPARF